jgi:BirA family transcriptional regulator, biotin operon repressor / biotin---[acetyl-CoA-carboxylase] ligase
MWSESGEVSPMKSDGEALEAMLEEDLDVARIIGAVSPAARTAVAALEVLASIDSTNSELLRRRTSPQGASVLFAEQQTGGRGRQGRVWVSPPACNLYVSIARYFAMDLARLSGLSLVVGVAVAEALNTLGADSICLKWPNDLVVDSDGELCKLGGILLESGGAQDGWVRAVIGVGVNVRMSRTAGRDTHSGASSGANADTDASAQMIDQPWTDLQRLLGAATPSRNTIAAAMLETLLPALQRFEDEGLAPTIERYSRFDALRGRMLVTHGGTETLTGTAEGLSEDGALRLRTQNGDILLRAGEVGVRKSAET